MFCWADGRKYIGKVHYAFKLSMKMIRRVGMEYLNGLMVESMKECG